MAPDLFALTFGIEESLFTYGIDSKGNAWSSNNEAPAAGELPPSACNHFIGCVAAKALAAVPSQPLIIVTQSVWLTASTFWFEKAIDAGGTADLLSAALQGQTMLQQPCTLNTVKSS
jgi:hypothetical protein